jgi:phage minor structural protein
MLTIYNEFTTNFNNNGIGILRDVISANIIEELNGCYELEMEYPIKGHLSEEIKEGNVIKARSVESYQLFRIKHVKKNLNRKTVVATHIFYDWNDDFIEDTYPQKLAGQAALTWLVDHTVNSNKKFTAYSDITKIATARYVRRNPVECLIGNIDNSFVNVWGGELERDNFTIKMLENRGKDTGYKIIFSKNLTGIEVDIDYSNVITKVMPQGFDGLLLPEKYVESSHINEYPNEKIKKVEFSEVQIVDDDEHPENNVNEETAYELLRTKAKELFDKDKIDVPVVDIKVELIELSKTREYKGKYDFLETLKLGDTLYTKVDALDVDISIKIVKYQWDVLKERYISLELGNIKSNYVTTQINQQKQNQEEFERIPNRLQQIKDFATSSIANAMGGYIYKTQSELFIMDTNDPISAQKVWRWNIEGLGYSKNGINGPFEIAMTSDGQIVADFITTGVMDANLITTGILKSQDGNFYINLNTGEFYSSYVEGLKLTVSQNSEDIEDNQKKIADVSATVDKIAQSIQISGGRNKVINSVGLYGTDQYEITGKGNTMFGEIADLKALTNSGAMIYATNKVIKHKEITLIEGQQYTITFKYSNTEGNNLIFKITNTDTIELVNTSKSKSLEEITYTFTSNGKITYQLECSYIDNTKGGFITDLIIKEGNLRSNWEPAIGEIMGTALSLYYNGVEITSASSDIKTVINNLGFSVYDTTNTSNIILTLNNLRVLLTNTEIKGTLKIETFLFQKMTIDSDDCLFIL